MGFSANPVSLLESEYYTQFIGLQLHQKRRSKQINK